MRQKAFHQTLILVFLFVSEAIPAQPTLWPEEDVCAFAVPAPLNDTVWMNGIASTKSELFALDVPSPGILGLEVAVPGAERTEPILLFLGLNCSTIEGAGAFAYLDQSARSHLMEVRAPGTYFIRVAASDPLQALARYKLSTRFVERTPKWPELLNKSEDDDIDIDEWDEEILSATVTLPDAPVSSVASRRARIQAFCNQGSETASGEFIWCATPITTDTVVQAELVNLWGDDFQYFTFTLDRTQVLRIESLGSTNTLGTLYDSLGNRLATAAAGGEGDNFGIIKILPPGGYALRVEGIFGSEGPYEIVVSSEVGLIE